MDVTRVDCGFCAGDITILMRLMQNWTEKIFTDAKCTKCYFKQEQISEVSADTHLHGDNLGIVRLETALWESEIRVTVNRVCLPVSGGAPHTRCSAYPLSPSAAQE